MAARAKGKTRWVDMVWVTCTRCLGKGYNRHTNETCPSCNGWGTVEDPVEDGDVLLAAADAIREAIDDNLGEATPSLIAARLQGAGLLKGAA